MMSDGNGATIEQLVARQRPGFTLEQPFYTDREVFDFDLERIVMRQWLFVDHVSRIPDAGDYILYKIASEEIIVVRDAAGEIHAHFNVCRHRGSRICLEAAGNVKSLTCPYHAWTYALDGRLTMARRMPDGFNPDDYPLHRCHLRVYQGMMFVNLAEGEPTDFDVIARNLDPFVVPHGIPRTKIVHVERYPTDGNWKLAVENFRECYHCPSAHPEYTRVNAYVRANDAERDGYAETIEAWNDKTAAMGHIVGSVHNNTELPEQPHGAFRQPIREGYLTLSKGGKQVGPLIGDFERFDGGEMMAVFGPLFYVYAANDHVCLFRFTPMTPTHTEVVLTWLVHEDAVEGVDYTVDPLKWMWHVTTVQDTRIIGNNQAGVTSRRYSPGRYSERERFTAAFTRWYLEQLGGAAVSEDKYLETLCID